MSWRRMLGSLVAVLVPTALVAFLYDLGFVAIALLLTAALCLAASLSDRGDTTRDREWTDRPDADSTPITRTAGGSVTRSLAVAELRELIFSPWFGAGVGFCVLFGLIAPTSFERSWWLSAALLPLLVHPLCGMTIVAVHRSTTRAQRDGAEELLESCPATREQRTGALLLTAVAPVVVATVFVVATLIGAAVALDFIYGPIDERVAAEALIAAVLLPAGAVTLGVILGRKLSFALTPFIVLAVIALLNIEMVDRGLDGRGWLTTGMASGKADLVYFEPPSIGRVIWFVGLAAFLAALALRRPGTTRSRIAVGAGAAVALAGMLVAVHPLDGATVDRLAAYVVEPAEYEACEQVAPEIQVCALDPYADHAANVAEYVRPVAAAIPAAAFSGPVTLRPTVGEGFEELPSQVREHIEPTPIPNDTIHIPYVHLGGDRHTTRFILAAAAVGVRTGPDAPLNTLVDGQARGVVMLWLATAGLDRDVVLDYLDPSDQTQTGASWRGNAWPGTCRATVQWSPQDLEAARALVALDRSEVAPILERDWERWTAPSTPTDDLMAALGLPAVGPHEPIEELGELC